MRNITKDRELISLGHSCLSKRRYKSLAQAKNYVNKFNHYGKEQRIYYCKHCLGWHITTKYYGENKKHGDNKVK